MKENLIKDIEIFGLDEKCIVIIQEDNNHKLTPIKYIIIKNDNIDKNKLNYLKRKYSQCNCRIHIMTLKLLFGLL